FWKDARQARIMPRHLYNVLRPFFRRADAPLRGEIERSQAQWYPIRLRLADDFRRPCRGSYVLPFFTASVRARRHHFARRGFVEHGHTAAPRGRKRGASVLAV